ncbi:Tn3 family transposase [Microvirga arsenatis]|uniref:Tn3 family transposase n=1 Tax=Microvirga arsenatis TaxID=2692265 RepID=A0ABW9Z858_9HYPH|nr:Tn3 family transposase [Microvirga arsenatis]NBJ13943.1 Tn3 family transposase [Microvirga arsenatis]NBJ27393.1 Tn3 family transposase [Microvirga arsenatis]
MARRKLLTPDERQALLGIPDDEESLIRHYTLSPQDRLQAEVRRRPHNQLGYAVQICIMRYPGRVLGMDEDPPAAVVAYVAEQLGIAPDVFASYARRIPTRFEHSHRLAKYLGVRTATRDDRRAALLAAAEAASATESGLPIMTAVVNELRRRGALLLPDAALEKIGLAGRAIARQRAEAALLNGLSVDQIEQLEALLLVDPAIQQTRLAWLRSAPDAPSADNLIGLMDRLTFVRTLAIDPQRQSRIHPERWTQIVREGDVTPAWLVADFGARRRRATLVAQAITLEQALTDAAVTMFSKLIGRLFARANARRKKRYVEAQQDTTKVLRLFRDTLRALVTASDTGRNAIDVLDDKVGWHRLLQAQPEVEAMVRDADPDPLLLAAERYSTIRKYTAQFLETLTFCSSRKHDSLLAAIGTLKTLQVANRRTLPERVPVGHLSARSRKLIFGDAGPDRRLYEIATLAVLRDRLRSGDIWVEGSHAFRPMDEQLMPKPAFTALKASDDLGLGVPQDAISYLSEARQTVDFNLKRLAYRARNGKLEGVRLEAGQLVVTPLPGDVPAAAEELKWELADMYPLIEVPDLLMEVHHWTGFADRFTHIRTQEPPRSIPAMLAGVLADATNLGAKRMAAASKGVSPQEITWKRIFHTRPETYKLAQACITDGHAQHPHALLWGDGSTASSDGQFFQASDRAGKRGDINLHYGSEPGSKFYSHLSDQYGYFSILPISATESEAPYVLDGLFDHETELDIQEHFTDTGGASDHVFGLFALTGRRFAPRLRNLKDRKLHTFEKPETYPALQEHIGVPINTTLIMEYWDDLLHLAASIQTRTVAPSTILKRLAASRNPSQLARALRELGRLERTLFMIEWYSDPALRRRCQAGLNKGEAAHKLKRAVFFHERGEIRDRSFESQAFRASGLNLVVSAIIHWNTVYLGRAVDHLRRQGRIIRPEVLKHVSPLSWEHINLTGTYAWGEQPVLVDGFRPLRLPKALAHAA